MIDVMRLQKEHLFTELQHFLSESIVAPFIEKYPEVVAKSYCVPDHSPKKNRISISSSNHGEHLETLDTNEEEPIQ